MMQLGAYVTLFVMGDKIDIITHNAGRMQHASTINYVNDI